MVTVLVTPDDLVAPENTQVLKRKWWAMQDSNLLLILCVGSILRTFENHSGSCYIMP